MAKKKRLCPVCKRPPVECECFEKFCDANMPFEFVTSENRPIDQGAGIRVIQNSHQNGGYSIAIALHEMTTRKAIEDAITAALEWRKGLIAWQGRKEATLAGYHDDLRAMRRRGLTISKIHHHVNEYLRERLELAKKELLRLSEREVLVENEVLKFPPLPPSEHEKATLKIRMHLESAVDYLSNNWGWGRERASEYIIDAFQDVRMDKRPWEQTAHKRVGRPSKQESEEHKKQAFTNRPAPITREQVREIVR